MHIYKYPLFLNTNNAIKIDEIINAVYMLYIINVATINTSAILKTILKL
jgi:hypothetical protein